ncbi:MAG TPA: hypothetical protein VG943_10330 [Caulobacterales bacterium]|nr:hypothetical protein [Caulobacterales bacterium]
MKSFWPLLLGALTAGFIAFLLGVSAAVGGEKPGFLGIAVGVAMGAVVLLVANNLSGNRAMTQADEETRRRALAFEVPPGQAALYVMRTGFVGKAAGMDLALDGRTFVQLKSPRFARLDIAPGPHTLAASFGGGLAAQTKPIEREFVAGAGDVIVMKLTLGFGAAKAPITIERVSLENVRPALAGMDMVATS